MKTAFTFLMLLSLNTAFAFKIGDRADFKGMLNEQTYQSSNEIVGIGPGAHIYKVRSLIVMADVPLDYTSEMNDDQLVSAEKVEAIFLGCDGSATGGVLETITVPAGTFETCVQHTEQGYTIYYARVPFGLAKMDGNGLSVELISYSH